MFSVFGKSIDTKDMFFYIWNLYSIYWILFSLEIKNIIFNFIILLFLTFSNIKVRIYLLKRLSASIVIIFLNYSIVYGKIKR